MSVLNRRGVQTTPNTHEINLTRQEKDRLISYSNTYYRKFDARLLQYKDCNAFAVQYLDNVDGVLNWNTAFHVDAKELHLILHGTKGGE